jgi:hypothetical protein
LSAGQLGQNPVVYEKDDALHVWTGKPDDIYCLIHNDPSYQALYQVAGVMQPCCLEKTAEWKDKDGRLHRDDGPAVIKPDGTQEWYQHDERHRDDGPAWIWPDGRQLWYQHNANGDQVCGFRELLDHLGTLTRNTVKVTTGTTNSFDMLTTPTPLQRQVFELLGAQVPHRLM